MRREFQTPVATFCQHAIVVVILTALALAPLAHGATQTWAQSILVSAITVAGLLWVVRILAQYEFVTVFSALGAPVVMLGAYGTIRYGLAEVEPIARQAMMLSLAGALLFFLVLNNFRHRLHLAALVWVLTGAGAFVAIVGLWQMISGDQSIWWMTPSEDYLGRASGTFVRPNHFAAYLQLVFPIAAANYLFSRRSATQRILSGLACLVMAAGLFFSYAYSGWLGWLAGAMVLGVFVIQKRGKKLRWFIAGTLIMAVLVIGVIIGLQALRAPISGIMTDGETNRLQLWRTAWQMGRSDLLLGAGPGMFPWLYPAHRGIQGQTATTGNEYLQLFAEFGIIGVALVLWLVIAFTVLSIQILQVRAQRYSGTTPSNRYAFAIGGLAAFAGIAVGSIFDSSLHAAANLFTLMTLVGAVLTCGVHPSGKRELDALEPGRFAGLPLKGIPKFVLAGALLVGVALLGSRVRKSLPSAAYIWQGEQQQNQLNWLAAESAYTKAWNFDGRSFEVPLALGDLSAARASWNPRQQETHLTTALTWYDRAFTRNPYANDTLIRMARIYDQLGRREQALERYQRALQADPQNASYHAEFGLYYLRGNESDKAISELRRAHELDEDIPLPEIQLRKLGALD